MEGTSRATLTASLRELAQLRLGSIKGFRISFVELDVERGVECRFDVMADAGNDRYAFARRCADSPRPLIDEQH